ncbi:Uncharacterised protein [Citrobacter freundii]|nr:Uncharacterised protein [Citrobacter freundii]
MANEVTFFTTNEFSLVTPKLQLTQFQFSLVKTEE